MKIPNAYQAVIPEEKVIQYLLSLTHRDGQGKARFFLAHGFSPVDWERFVAMLRKHVVENEVVKVEETDFGMRYTIDGDLSTPKQTKVRIRSVWFIEAGEEIPRLVTAYPLKGG